jgi:MFS superfamily sulfate permease-like transporter
LRDEAIRTSRRSHIQELLKLEQDRQEAIDALARGEVDTVEHFVRRMRFQMKQRIFLDGLEATLDNLAQVYATLVVILLLIGIAGVNILIPRLSACFVGWYLAVWRTQIQLRRYGSIPKEDPGPFNWR